MVVCVPSGNLGNLTAGLFAKRMGLPIDRFVSAHNINDSFVRFLEGQPFKGVDSRPTLSNAMDVGRPSNFERIQALYKKGDLSIYNQIKGYSFSDGQTLEAMQELWEKYKYLACPHSAIAYKGIAMDRKGNEKGIFLASPHAHKFADVVGQIKPHFSAPVVNLAHCEKNQIKPELTALKDCVLQRKEY